MLHSVTLLYGKAVKSCTIGENLRQTFNRYPPFVARSKLEGGRVRVGGTVTWTDLVYLAAALGTFS